MIISIIAGLASLLIPVYLMNNKRRSFLEKIFICLVGFISGTLSSFAILYIIELLYEDYIPDWQKYVTMLAGHFVAVISIVFFEKKEINEISKEG